MTKEEEQASTLLDIQLIVDEYDNIDNPHLPVTITRYVEHVTAKAVRAERERVADELTLMRQRSTGLNRTSSLGKALKDYIYILKSK